MPDKHAFLAPSSAERWYNCPPSAWLCEQYPDLGSVAAAEGTEAHHLCEYLLKGAFGKAGESGESGLKDPRPQMRFYTEEMEECCQGYLQYVSEIVEGFRKAGAFPMVYVEQGVDLRRFIPESYGTSDCVIVGGHQIVIVDFKYGMHLVPAESLQFRIYALGACELFAALYEIESVKMAVYQPRIGNVDECSMTREELYEWASGELKERAQQAFTGKGEYAVGVWCRNCRARRQCRFLAEEQLALVRFDFKDPPLLTDEEICEVLPLVDRLVDWAEGVRQYALEKAALGKQFPGWKVVEGRSVRRFTDDTAVCARVSDAGFDPYEKRMLGVAAMEKRLGRKDFRNLLSDLVVRRPGKPLLVPESDRRPEMDIVNFAAAFLDSDDALNNENSAAADE